MAVEMEKLRCHGQVSSSLTVDEILSQSVTKVKRPEKYSESVEFESATFDNLEA
jgi:hypothetical protein